MGKSIVRTVAVISIAFGLLSACGQKTDVEYIARAVEFQDQGDLRSASIEFKNALKANPENVDARLALGEIYLQFGDNAGAEKEFVRALAAGGLIELSQPLLMKAMLYQDKFDELIALENDISTYPQRIQPVAYALVGEALLKTGKKDKAEVLFNKSIKIKTDSSRGLYGLGLLAFSRGDNVLAMEKLKESLESGEDSDVRLMMGTLLLRNKDFAGAIQHYDQVIARELPQVITGRGLKAYIGKLEAMLAEGGESDDALALVENLLKIQPDNPFIRYFRGLIAHRKGEYDVAEENLLVVNRFLPSHQPSLLLLGAINFSQGEMGQAETYLSKYLSLAPGHIPARKLLAAVRMKLNQPELAMSTLEPLMRDAGNDIQALAMAGSAAFRSGDSTVGASYLRKALTADPGNDAVRTELALALLANNDVGQAIRELEKAAGGDDGMKAGVLLVLTHLRENNMTKALSVAKDLETQFPETPLSSNLLGVVYEQLNDDVKARASFEKATSIFAEYTPAVVNLARLDLKAGELKSAQARYEFILVYDPKNILALVALSEIAAKKGDTVQAVEWLKEAIRIDEKALEPRLRLANYHIRNNDISLATVLIDEARAIDPDNVAVLATMGLAASTEKNYARAVDAYDRIIKHQPELVAPYFQKALIYLKTKESAKAKLVLRKAIDIEPNYMPARALLVQLELKDGRTAAANKLLTGVGEKGGTEQLVVLELKGDIHLAKSEYKQAIEVFKKLFDARPHYISLLKLSNAYFLNDEEARSKKLLQSWLIEHPSDMPVHLAIAGFYERSGEWEKVIDHYEALLTDSEGDARIYNNLAWAYHSVGDSRALELARKAADLTPYDGNVLDTLGWILVKKGDSSKAVDILRDAVKYSPDNLEIRYHLAYALIEIDQRSEAKAILDQLAGRSSELSVGTEGFNRLLDQL